jgi:hypothetical protein
VAGNYSRFSGVYRFWGCRPTLSPIQLLRSYLVLTLIRNKVRT